mmetsp:Transcript_23451/g.76308  ORF Transcript_23451/g.76308 Transcript_23451/m.76308 type:complete len:323 (-) Transcript_23451:381-1349(-)
MSAKATVRGGCKAASNNIPDRRLDAQELEAPLHRVLPRVRRHRLVIGSFGEDEVPLLSGGGPPVFADGSCSAVRLSPRAGPAFSVGGDAPRLASSRPFARCVEFLFPLVAPARAQPILGPFIGPFEHRPHAVVLFAPLLPPGLASVPPALVRALLYVPFGVIFLPPFFVPLPPFRVACPLVGASLDARDAAQVVLSENLAPRLPPRLSLGVAPRLFSAELLVPRPIRLLPPRLLVLPALAVRCCTPHDCPAASVPALPNLFAALAPPRAAVLVRTVRGVVPYFDPHLLLLSNPRVSLWRFVARDVRQPRTPQPATRSPRMSP